MKTESFEVLEVGREYLSREGKVVKIKAQCDYTIFPFTGDNGECYTTNGRYWQQRKAPQDLISRIPKSTTLTIQRWGVLTKSQDCLLTSTINKKMPFIFKTRKQARHYIERWWQLGKHKVVKIKCTYEVIE